MLYSFVLCPHRVERDLFADRAERDPESAFLQMLWERGSTFEADTLDGLDPKPVDLRGLGDAERERATLDALRDGAPLILGARLRHDDLLGEPDVIQRVGRHYLAGDVKSGRGGEEPENGESPGKLKKHYAVQLALYVDLLERHGFAQGHEAFVWDVTGAEIPYPLDQPQGPKTPETWWAFYQRILASARDVVRREASTRAALTSDCKLCHWHTACGRELETSHDLSLIPEVGRSRRDQLGRHFVRLEDFAGADVQAMHDADPGAFKGLGIKSVRRWQARARLQIAPKSGAYTVEPLPLPEGETILYFDVETDPMLDFCYLHGFWVVERGKGRFVEFHTADDSRDEEKRAFAEAVAFVRAHPDAPIVHYSPYERVTWRALGARFPDVADPDTAEALMQPPRAFDLYHGAVRPHTVWPTRDYSIKSIAKHLGFSWRDQHPSGAASIEWFQHWLETRDPSDLQRILDYNEDDCRAMEVVLDALRMLPVRPEA